jgi:hypothetical protein
MQSRDLSRVILPALVAGGILTAGPASAAAQSSSTNLGLWGGVFTPLGKNVELGNVGGQVSRNNSFAGGARLSLWGSGLFGFEVVAGISPANVDVAGATVNGSRNLNIFAGGAKLMLGLSPNLSPLGIHVGAGPAIVRRGKDVGQQSGSSTSLGAVVGAGMRFPMSSAIGLRVDGEDYIYKGDFGGSNETRNDLILSAGISIGL